MSSVHSLILRWLGRLLLAVMGVVVALVATVFLTQPKIREFPHPEYPFVRRYTPNARWTRMYSGDLARLTGNPEHRVMREVTQITDSYGFMNNESDPLAQEPIRVLAIGDSFTASPHLDQTLLWPNQLQESLGARVYNMGHPSEGPWHAVMNFQIERHRLQLSSNAVVVWALFSGNDIENSYGDDTMLPPPRSPSLRDRTFGSLRRYWRASAVWRVLARARHGTQAREKVELRKLGGERQVLFKRYHYDRAIRSLDDLKQHPNVLKMRECITEMRDLCARDDLELMVVCIPSKPEVYRWLYEEKDPWSSPAGDSSFSQAVKDMCRELDVPCPDMMPVLIVKSQALYEDQNEILYWADDTHFNRWGHEAVAQRVFQQLCP